METALTIIAMILWVIIALALYIGIIYLACRILWAIPLLRETIRGGIEYFTQKSKDLRKYIKDKMNKSQKGDTMGYKIFKIINRDYYRERQGENHPIIRYDVPEFNTYEDAVKFIVNERLTTNSCLDDFRIFKEYAIRTDGEEGGKIV